MVVGYLVYSLDLIFNEIKKNIYDFFGFRFVALGIYQGGGGLCGCDFSCRRYFTTSLFAAD